MSIDESYIGKKAIKVNSGGKTILRRNETSRS